MSQKKNNILCKGGQKAERERSGRISSALELLGGVKGNPELKSKKSTQGEKMQHERGFLWQKKVQINNLSGEFGKRMLTVEICHSQLEISANIYLKDRVKI